MPGHPTRFGLHAGRNA